MHPTGRSGVRTLIGLAWLGSLARRWDGSPLLFFTQVATCSVVSVRRPVPGAGLPDASLVRRDLHRYVRHLEEVKPVENGAASKGATFDGFLHPGRRSCFLPGFWFISRLDLASPSSWQCAIAGITRPLLHREGVARTCTPRRTSCRIIPVPTSHRSTEKSHAFSGPILQPDSPQTWVQMVHKLGYRAAFCPLKPGADEPAIAEYTQAARAAGIVIAEVGAWSNPLSPDEAERARALELCKESLWLAECIGANCCVITGSRGPFGTALTRPT
jgi:hypothetical protein